MNWTNIKVWLHGLFAAAISAAATSISGALALPTVFSLDRNGFTNMIKLAIPPAMLAVALYLKSSPIPPLKATVDQDGNVKVQGNPVLEVQVEGKKEN